MSRVLRFAAAAMLATLLWGCGERAQNMTEPTKTGVYQGKHDNQPWNNQPWNGDKTQWEVALKARNQNQNEYTRVP